MAPTYNACGRPFPTPDLDRCQNPELCERCRRKLARKKWAAANPEKDAAAKRASRDRRRGAINQRRRDAWKSNPTRNKAWIEANREKVRDSSFSHKLRKVFGINMERWRAMYSKQNGCCAICGKHGNGQRRLHVDHDHATGKVRALLCVNCNHMLGCAKEQTSVLLRAVDYLLEHGAPRLVERIA